MKNSEAYLRYTILVSWCRVSFLAFVLWVLALRTFIFQEIAHACSPR